MSAHTDAGGSAEDDSSTCGRQVAVLGGERGVSVGVFREEPVQEVTVRDEVTAEVAR